MRRRKRRERVDGEQEDETRVARLLPSLLDGLLAHESTKLDMLQNGAVMSEYRQDVVLQE